LHAEGFPLSVRTRVAPSPTGDPHVGTAYMALFNYCFARKNGGQFLLRIEDTDQARSTAASEAAILRALRWLGLGWDEGPDVGGPHGPYRQSERGAIYRKHAEQLLEQGHAFRCYCTTERLEQLRKAQQKAGLKPGYDGHCLNLTAAERQSLESASAPHVIRMKVPEQGICALNDLLRGRIEIDWRTVDMQVLVKADGLPTYHLANVVDDHLMEITHVIRGEEWISSAPKHQLLYEYFGWQMPALCHMPLLRNPDKSKLSKRKNPTGILYYQRMGYLSEALLNYLGLMAWSMPAASTDSAAEEKFSLADMVEQFDLNRVSLGGPVFDIKKLNWLNGRWLREDLTDEQFADRVRQWALNPDYLMPIVPLVKSRVSILSELGPLAAFFVSGELDLTPEKIVDPKVPLEILRKSLAELLEKMEELVEWKKEPIGSLFKALAERHQIKLRDFLRPFYVAIAGSTTSTPLFDSMEILGRDLCRARLRRAQNLLSATGSKN
jgi:glutamyl-tRNA synthetase